MTNKWQDFEYYGWDEKDPIGKYTQPKKNLRYDKSSGYISDTDGGDIDRQGTKTYGRYVKGTGHKKNRMDIRGCGNTERGKRFYIDDDIRGPIKTDGKY
jgi:hypothetical protein